jgi:hypothetical protein
MPIFVSYSREDVTTVKILAEGFEAADRTVWYDHNLKGGDIWWSTILRQIRACDVFLFAKSDHSLASQACLAELDYAKALQREILPVQVGQVTAERSNLLADIQYVEFRPDHVISGFVVLDEVDRASERAGPLPHPLPDEPAIPFAYLGEIRDKIKNGNLGNTAQLEIIEQLRHSLGEENDPSARRDIVAILKQVLDSSWRSVAAGKMIGYVLLAHEMFEEKSSGAKHSSPTEQKLAQTVPGWSEETARTTFLERINEMVGDMQAGQARHEARNAPPTKPAARPRVFEGVGISGLGDAPVPQRVAPAWARQAAPDQNAARFTPPSPPSPRPPGAAGTASRPAPPTARAMAQPPAAPDPLRTGSATQPKPPPLIAARVLALATLVISTAFALVVALLRGGVAAVFLLSAAAGLMALLMSRAAAKRVADGQPAEARRPATLSIVWGLVGVAIAVTALMMFLALPLLPPPPPR